MPPSVRSQLALQVPAELLACLQAAATVNGRSKTSLLLSDYRGRDSFCWFWDSH